MQGLTVKSDYSNPEYVFNLFLKDIESRSLREVAREVGVDPTTVRKWKMGDKPSFYAYQSIVAYVRNLDLGSK
jgi:hypothetical protein